MYNFIKTEISLYLDTLYPTTQHICLCNFRLNSVPNLTKFTNLKYIDLSYNNISDINIYNIPNSVNYINLEHNLINTMNIFEQFTNLNILILNNNYIEELYNIKSLKILEINNNYITSFKNCPKNLIELSCKSNKINSLRYLPKVIKLDISDNSIILDDF